MTEPSVRKLLLGILSWVAERERELLIERTKAGMERARAEGKKCGRPAFDWTPEILSFVNDSLLAGQSVYSIARSIHISKVTLYQALHDYELFAWFWSPFLAQARQGRPKGKG